MQKALKLHNSVSVPPLLCDVFCFHGYWLVTSPYREIFSACSYLSDYWDCIIFFFPPDTTAPSGPGPPYYRGTKLSRTPLGVLSARHTDLYLTTHKTHKRQIFKPSVGFEPVIPASKPLQTYAVECAATGIGNCI